MRKLVTLLGFVSMSMVTLGQQDPIYAQYLNNPLSINPAFAGSNKMFNASLQYRTQWAGIEANPLTINFSSHTSVLQNQVGLGIQVVQDKLGDTENTEFNAVYSYKINFKKSSLSFGMQSGFIRYTNNPSQLNIYDAGDDAFNTYSEMKFNTGAGLLLKADRYILGLSVPRLLPATISQGGQPIELYSRNYYLFGSYVLFLGDKLRFKPSVLLRGTKGSPLSADVNASFTLREFYTAGLFTRNFKTYGLLAQVIVKKFKLGYVYELPAGSDAGLNFTSHEIMIGLSLAALTYHDHAPKTY